MMVNSKRGRNFHFPNITMLDSLQRKYLNTSKWVTMEMVLSEFTKQVIISLGNLAGNEIAKVLCVKNEISRLSRKLDSMTAIIRDAEQTVMQNETTRDWLKRSREIIYEAENITDRCRIERERFQTLQPQVRKCLDSSLIFILYLQGWIFALWFFFLVFTEESWGLSK